MDNPPQVIAGIFALFLFAGPAILFFIRGIQSPQTSRRLANLALSCGFALLISPETLLGLSPGLHPTFGLILGIIRCLIGLTGVVLVGSAFAKRSDGAIGIARPILAVVLCLAHVLIGCGLLVYSRASVPGTSWIYHSAEHDFRLKLPSSSWKQATKLSSPAVVAFFSPVPQMQAGVRSVAHNQSKVDFDNAVDGFRKYIGNAPVVFREGTNAAGNHYSYWTGVDSSPDGKPVYFAHSITWCPHKQLLIPITFEGLPTALSKTMQATEKRIVEEAAEVICLSVE